MTKNDGGPAFPFACFDGMSLREWYIGQALANPAVSTDRDGNQLNTDFVAAFAIAIADAVLARLEAKDAP